ncbi:hypothetical protein RBH29_15125 [Herbivorax sp. ANBcel31]|uniref:hypothetical protein n=1 Tax=Herbivorax sp. ANBcel31 TaxID=3069754 RepID=UPI0027B1C3B1|nr:hypothetical protein [Herbivorax sp. ANBcel31]MDQ2087761.1 hypothetical protein [Herbivorax sp. ANBcel31]
MNKTIAINSETFLNTILLDESNLSDFISIIDIIKPLAYTISLPSDEHYLNEIYEMIYAKSKNEDIRILSKMFEKIVKVIEVSDYEKLINEINQLIEIESSSFKKILQNNDEFNYNNKIVEYKKDDIKGLRNISNIDQLKQVLLLFCICFDEINDFINELKLILAEIVFDRDIVDSIKKLSDGFERRKREIIYHLYYIDKEIPDILKSNISYKDIGEKMSIDCSPERDRKKVNEQLSRIIDNVKINCELHTKMKRISNEAPDRIYFCPSVPKGVSENLFGKIYVYKISRHA